jgi:pterin-4a-carbinolamine dehydratase
MVRSFSGIANVYVGEKDYQKALVYLTRASKLAEEINATPDLKDIYQDMAIAYSKTADYKMRLNTKLFMPV